MEQPQVTPSIIQEPDIPHEFATAFKSDKKRLESYDLDHPDQKFIPLLTSELGKETDVITYLKNLQLFASLLYLQQRSLQSLSDRICILIYYNKIKEESATLLKKLGGVITSPTLSKIEMSNEDLPEYMAHSQIISKESAYNPEELEVIYSWIYDPTKSEQIHNLGRKLTKTHELFLNRPILGNTKKTLYDTLSDKTSLAISQMRLSQVIDSNTDYLQKIIANEAETFQRQQKIKQRFKDPQEQSRKLEYSQNDYIKEANKITGLYALTHQWYEKMYTLVRKEINNVIQNLIRKNLGNKQLIAEITQHAALLPPSTQESGIHPKILPETVTPYKTCQASQFPSLKNELEAARLRWEKMPVIKKAKKTYKKKIKTPNISPETEGEAQEITAEEIDDQIIIDNPAHHTTEIIFKTDKPFQIQKQLKAPLPKISYTDWVSAWFINPDKALENQGYLDPKNKNKFTAEHLRWKPIILHAFSPEIDNFIAEWGTATSIPSRRYPGKQDVLVTIPGMIKYPAGSDPKEETGVYAYIIDSENGQWYHRMFEPQTGQKLIGDLFKKGYFSPEMTGYYEVFFPPLPSKK